MTDEPSQQINDGDSSDRAWRDAAALSGDRAAHVLLVRDALDRRHGPALVRAIRAVAQARGLARVADDAGVSARILVEAMIAAETTSSDALQQLAEMLATRWSKGAERSSNNGPVPENDKKPPRKRQDIAPE